jgi:ribonuclease/clavin/mitogillin
MHRTAVSILLTPGFDSDRVLLVKRSPELVFFGGYYAFPGGTLDAADAAVPVRNLSEPAGPGELTPFVAAAARELFEETGVFLRRGEGRPPAERLAAYRRALLSEEVSFAEILTREGQHLDGRDFRPLCRITTPPFAPRRYDTWFFACRLPPEASVEVWPGELEAGEFAAAAEALTRWRAGEMLIVPPVVIFLGELSGHDVETLIARAQSWTAAYAGEKLHRVYFTPGVLLAPLKTPTRPPATHTNTYVVGEERLFLIDPAPVDRAEQEKLWGLLDELQAEGRKLESILLTHYHPDHVGSVAEAQRRYALPVYAHADTARELPELTCQRYLKEAEELPLGDSPDGGREWSLQVYHVPGHAPGHLAFRETRYKALLVGDLVSTLSSILIDPRDGHLATYMKSLELLEPLAEGALYPGHGPPAREGRKAIRAQIAHRRQRESQLLAALGPEPRSVSSLLAEVYRDVDEKLLPLAERSLLSGLLKLEEEGRVERAGSGYRLREI